MKNPFESFTGNISKYKRLSGGDINEVYLIECHRGQFVLKTNDRPLEKMFALEAKGLATLKEAGLPVPHVVDFDESALLLEYFKPGPASPAEAGRNLAGLHSQSWHSFGLDYDNYIATLAQVNTPGKNWPEFYFKYRIESQLKLLRANLPDHDTAIWQQLGQRLPEIITHDPKPSLLHGDLWSGNLVWSDQGPIFIDPAVYYGDALVELAFTRLFGAFGSQFYDAYNEVFPISANFNDLVKLYQVYPLLVHANLFGGSYYQQALSHARYYV